MIALALSYGNRWLRHVKRRDLEEMVARSDKVRFELKDDKIRALYGHSYYSPSYPFTKIHKIASKPPDILYHNTFSSAAKNMNCVMHFSNSLSDTDFNTSHCVMCAKVI